MQIISRAEAKQQNLTHYFTGKPCKHGHIAERRSVNGSCLRCVNEQKKERNDKRVVKNGTIGRPEARTLGLQHYFTGKKCKKGHLSKRHTSSAICMECSRLHSANERVNNPRYMVEYNHKYKTRRNDRRKSDPDHRCLLKMREVLRRVIILTKSKKMNNTQQSLGYSPEDLKLHIERLFTKGMSWDNHGEWHIDHIVPVKWWIDNNVTDPAQINALINLQPLWASENLSKGSKI